MSSTSEALRLRVGADLEPITATCPANLRSAQKTFAVGKRRRADAADPVASFCRRHKNLSHRQRAPAHEHFCDTVAAAARTEQQEDARMVGTKLLRLGF